MRRALIWICVCAWALLLFATLYDSLMLPKKFVVDGVDVTADLLHRQLLIYAWIAAGLCVALIGLRLSRWSVLTTVVSSLTYLIVWYARGPMSEVGAVEGYKLLWQTALRFHLYASFLIRDIVVPAALLSVLAGAVLQLFSGVRSRPPRSPA